MTICICSIIGHRWYKGRITWICQRASCRSHDHGVVDAIAMRGKNGPRWYPGDRSWGNKYAPRLVWWRRGNWAWVIRFGREQPLFTEHNRIGKGMGWHYMFGRRLSFWWPPKDDA